MTGQIKLPIKILALTIIAAFLIAGASFHSYAFEMPDNITVGLRYGATAVNKAVISCDAGLSYGVLEDDVFEADNDLEGETEIHAITGDGGIELRASDDRLLQVIDPDMTGCIMALDEESPVCFNESRYRGGIVLLQEPSGRITVINRLGIEEYLYGVLNQEMSGSNPMEALKAQAVAARSFAAVKQYTHMKDYGFGVCATTHCQVYKGYDGETENTNQAVDETCGQLIYSDGLPVQAYYHKNSGGSTEDSENVWYAALSYLRGIVDPYSPHYPWSLSLDFEEVRDCLEKAGYVIGSVQAVEIDERTDSGSVYSLRIEGTKGTVILQKDKIRSIFGSTRIKSTMFDLEGAGESLTLIGSDGSAKAAARIYVVSRDGIHRSLSRADMYVSGSNGTVSKIDVTVTGDQLTISGSGYGHRIGMSQDGAIEMAKQGFSYEEILEFYYSDVEIR